MEVSDQELMILRSKCEKYRVEIRRRNLNEQMEKKRTKFLYDFNVDDASSMEIHKFKNDQVIYKNPRKKKNKNFESLIIIETTIKKTFNRKFFGLLKN